MNTRRLSRFLLVAYNSPYIYYTKYSKGVGIKVTLWMGRCYRNWDRSPNKLTIEDFLK